MQLVHYFQKIMWEPRASNRFTLHNLREESEMQTWVYSQGHLAPWDL